MTTLAVLLVVLVMYAATVAPVLAEDWPEAIGVDPAPGGAGGAASPATVLGTHVDVYA